MAVASPPPHARPGGRYIVQEQIGMGGMGVVYRALDRLTGTAVALKQIRADEQAASAESETTAPQNTPGALPEATDESDPARRRTPLARSMLAQDGTDPTNASEARLRLALAHEFETLASLRHPHIISVLDYGFDADGLPFYTMTLIEGAMTIAEYASATGQRWHEAVRLVGEMLSALVYLHRRGILHRDIKPGNVLVAAGRVKLVDFGLSTARAMMRPGDLRDEAVGTLGYIAPEVLMGGAASETSDLFAVGVILYELVTGDNPFIADNPGETITRILGGTVDATPFDGQPALWAVVSRLLDKEPTQRYADARTALHALMEAGTTLAENPGADVRERQALSLETAAVRESFLQAAAFVGRETEMARLRAALKLARGGMERAGSAWLIGGESGVGKTRLLDELRTQALVDGMQAARGQAVNAGGLPYQAWRPIVRAILLLVEPSDLEAAVIKALVPDVAALLGRPVGDAPELDLQATQERLLSTIETLFMRQQTPMLVTLEDLHWANAEDLRVLERLTRLVEGLPLVVVASYRDDERPDLPGLLPDMTQVKLERLARGAIAALSESMLGAAGRERAVVELLMRETEGNVYFVVEVVRALAEEAGDLADIRADALPHTVFAGGVAAVVERRLARVPDTARTRLRMAAALGRVIDMAALAEADDDEGAETPLNAWIAVCCDAAVLSVREGQFQFAHDKLRERLLDEVASGSAAERAAVYGRAAQAVEQAYANDPEQAARLAHLWQMAGNAEREAHWAAAAAEHALVNGAHPLAITHFERALALDVQPALRQAQLEEHLSEALYAMGRLEASREHVERALTLTRFPMPHGTAGQIGALVGAMVTQWWHRRQPGRYEYQPQTDEGERRTTGDAAAGGAASYRTVGTFERGREVLVTREPALERIDPALIIQARAYDRLGILYYLANQPVAAMLAGFRFVNAAERVGLAGDLARAYINQSVAFGLIPMHQTSERYVERALRAARDAPPAAQRWAVFVSGLQSIGVGRFERALDALDRALAMVQAQGDRNGYEETMTHLSYCHLLRGEYARTIETARRLREASIQRLSAVNELSGWITELAARVRLGDTSELAQVADVVARRTDEAYDVARISAYGLLASAYEQLGQPDTAAGWLARVMPIIRRQRPSSYTSLFAYSEPAAWYLRRWAAGDANAAAEARAVNKALVQFAAIFPMAQTTAERTAGMVAYLSGDTAKAARLWAAALASAEGRRQPYETGLAHAALMRVGTDAERAQHRAAAYTILTDIEARWELERLADA